MLNLNNQQDENEVNNHKKKEHLNEMQEKCVEQLDGFVLVLAGAGTGKTKVLISRFLSHIKNGIYPNEILCITFSNKAAYEIQKRIEQHLPEIEGLWAGTFHKICFRLLQMYGNLPSNISIIDEYDQKNIADKLDIMNFLKDIQLHTENLLLDQSSDFLRAYEKYQAFITQNNLIDFGGIIKKTVEMIDKNPHIKEIIQNKFKYIMVDEYQDTSKMQNYLIASMAKENLFCVGDDDQSIYGWRGACVKNILEFQKNFPNSKIFRLEQNYRSTCEILSVANHIIQQNNNRMRKEIWTEKTGSKVKICCTKYEPQYIAGEIKNLPENETVGILVRSSSLIKPIEVALVKYDIPYKVIGGYNFFEKLEIKTAIAYLKAVFFEDILSIERILATPKKGIGPIKLKKTLQQIQHGLSFSSALRELGCADFSEKIRYWKSLIDEKPAKIMKIIWEESGCDDLFHDRVENITILMEKLNQFNTITDFLTNFFTINTEEEARISIMTIHKSKGLEFDNVFIPGWIEGVFPNGRSIVEGNLEEERRLAYVSVTRAKKQLFLSYNLSQSTYKNNMFGSSRFLFNLPQKSVDFEIM